jgi:hypothetical protein
MPIDPFGEMFNYWIGLAPSGKGFTVKQISSGKIIKVFRPHRIEAPDNEVGEERFQPHMTNMEEEFSNALDYTEKLNQVYRNKIRLEGQHPN